MAMRTKRIWGRDVNESDGSCNLEATHLEWVHARASVALDLQQTCGDVHEDAKDLCQQDVREASIAVIEGHDARGGRRVQRDLDHGIGGSIGHRRGVVAYGVWCVLLGKGGEGVASAMQAGRERTIGVDGCGTSVCRADKFEGSGRVGLATLVVCQRSRKRRKLVVVIWI